MEIVQALVATAQAVGAVRKGEKNSHQGFNFRGIDTVVNAVSPALLANGVVVLPRLLSSAYETVRVGAKETLMGHARVTVEYAFYACDGSSISAVVAAEAMDSGDKATAKAMSVAFRTALLQALCLPTDETDPDADTFARSSVKSTVEASPPIRAPHPSAGSDMAAVNGVRVRGNQHGPLPDWLVLEAFQAGVTEVYDNRADVLDNPKRPWFKATSGGKDAKAFWAPKGTPMPVIAMHEDDLSDPGEEEPF
jgi:hypothetical protein